MKVQKLLNNKYLLWAVVFFAFMHVLSYLRTGDLDTLSFFIASGWLTTFFSKNLLLQLAVALFATNVLYIGDNFKEGLTEKKDEEDAGKKEVAEITKTLKKSIAAIKNSEEKDEKKKDEKKKDEKFSQRNVPTSVPSSLKNDDRRVGNRVDYAATLEQAYDNLQNMLGSDGMRGLTDETKKLVDQQKNLVESLKTMVPALQGAKEQMGNLESLTPSLGNLQEMMNTLTTTLNKK